MVKNNLDDDNNNNNSDWRQTENINHLRERLKCSMIQEAEEMLGEKPKNSRNGRFDEEYAKVIRFKNETRKRLLRQETRKRAEEYKKARRIARRLFRKKKKEHFREKLKLIERERLNRVPRKFYKEIKSAKLEYNP